MPRGERGSASVEFALVLPLVLATLLALIQVGLVLRDQLVVLDAARAGAREASVTLDEGEVRSAVAAAAAGLDPASLDVSVSREGTRGSEVRVAVTYVRAVQTLGFELTVPLRGTVTMRQEVES